MNYNKLNLPEGTHKYLNKILTVECCVNERGELENIVTNVHHEDPYTESIRNLIVNELELKSEKYDMEYIIHRIMEYLENEEDEDYY